MNKYTNVPLSNAVLDLKYNKGIKTNTIIANETGYSRQVTNDYIGGRKKASPEFLKAFENAFNLKLRDYEVKKPMEPIAAKAGERDEFTVNKLIKLERDLHVMRILLFEHFKISEKKFLKVWEQVRDLEGAAGDQG